MAITAGMVKELREMTGAGMMDCKKALTETNGDMDAAVEVLRKSGAAKMEKKQSRIAAEGIARVAVNGNVAVVAEVNSETDFVAKNETFQEFVQTVADTALASGLNGGANGEDIDALLATNGLSELLVEKTATIGEKLSVHSCNLHSNICDCFFSCIICCTICCNDNADSSTTMDIRSNNITCNLCKSTNR